MLGPGQDRANLRERRGELLPGVAGERRERILRRGAVVVSLLGRPAFRSAGRGSSAAVRGSGRRARRRARPAGRPWRSPRSCRRSRRPGRAGGRCRRPTRGPGRSGRPRCGVLCRDCATMPRKRPYIDVDAGLEQLVGFGRRALEQVRLARQRRRLHPVGADPELLQRALEARQHPEHADRSGDRRRLGVDEVGRASRPNSRPMRRRCPSRRRPGSCCALASSSAWRMRSEASTEPPGLSTRTTSALMPLSRTPSSISLAMVSPPAVPGPALPSTIVPAIVTTPIGPLGRLRRPCRRRRSASLMRLVSARARSGSRRRAAASRASNACGRRCGRPGRRQAPPWPCRRPPRRSLRSCSAGTGRYWPWAAPA